MTALINNFKHKLVLCKIQTFVYHKWLSWCYPYLSKLCKIGIHIVCSKVSCIKSCSAGRSERLDDCWMRISWIFVPNLLICIPEVERVYYRAASDCLRPWNLIRYCGSADIKFELVYVIGRGDFVKLAVVDDNERKWVFNEVVSIDGNSIFHTYAYCVTEDGIDWSNAWIFCLEIRFCPIYYICSCSCTKWGVERVGNCLSAGFPCL